VAAVGRTGVLRHSKVFSRRFLPYILLVAAVVSRYHSSLHSFWIGDDTQILKTAATHGISQFLFSPKVWRELTAMNFTPWVTLSFYFDWKIFGASPYGFYLHHLSSLSLLVVCVYLVLKEWFSPVFSFLGALLFALTSPFAESSQFLMERHYIEGMIFALLSFYFFVKAVRSGNSGLLLLSPFLYLSACSAKEIYVPLIFLLPLFQTGSFRRRLMQLLPFVAALSLYVLWRWYMLGRLGGGYGLQLSWPQDAVLLFPRIMNAVVTGFSEQMLKTWRWVAGTSSVAALGIILILDRKAFYRVLLVCPLLLLPIIPVSPAMTGRFVFLLSFFWISLFIVAWTRLRGYAKGPIASAVIVLWALLLFSAFLHSSSEVLEGLRNGVRQQGIEGEFVLSVGSDTDLVINPKSPGHYYAGLSWLRKDIFRLSAGPSVTADSAVLCLDKETAGGFKRVWYVSPKTNAMVAENFTDFVAAQCADGKLPPLRKDAPLSLKLEYNGKTVAWEFGPYRDGTYQLLFEKTAGTIYPLPVSGSHFVYLNDMTIPFRLRYASPDGWVTYSPLIDFRITSDGGRAVWRR